MPKTLLHFSENPDITHFRPHRPRGREDEPPRIWAIDEMHAPLYWFPRDCPRVTFWADAHTRHEDSAHFLAHTTAARVHAVESAWLGRIRTVTLYVYHLSAADFAPYPEAEGHWVARREVAPLACERVGDLLERHVEAAIELRLTPSLWPLADAVAASTLQFSMVRMRNAQPRA